MKCKALQYILKIKINNFSPLPKQISVQFSERCVNVIHNFLHQVEDECAYSNQTTLNLSLQVTELKFIARQSATLNNQFKKGMKHLAMCKRKKCSVCAYTKATFGEYADRGSE
jgi:hypothetical protein